MVLELRGQSDLDARSNEIIIFYKGKLDKHDKNRMPIDASFQNYVMNNSPKHAHEYVQIIYIESGRMIHLFENSIDVLVKGDCVIIPPHEIHKMHVQNNEFANYYLVNFLFDAVCSDLDQQKIDYAYIKNFLIKTDQYVIKYSFIDDAQNDVEFLLKQIVKNVILNEHDTQPYFQIRQLLVRSLLMSLLAILSLKNTIESEHDIENQALKSIFTAVQYIDENYNQDICFEEILQLTHLSASNFRKLFKNCMGKTFNRYLVGCRINMAKKYLENSSKNITDICYEVGFNDLSHFTRSFKNSTGHTPSEYRNLFSNKKAP